MRVRTCMAQKVSHSSVNFGWNCQHDSLTDYLKYSISAQLARLVRLGTCLVWRKCRSFGARSFVKNPIYKNDSSRNMSRWTLRFKIKSKYFGGKKTKIIKELKFSKIFRKLKTELKFFEYYRKFVSWYANIEKPLIKLKTRGIKDSSKKGKARLNWALMSMIEEVRKADDACDVV